MDVRFWCEEEGIDEVGDQDEEDKGGVDVPAFDDVLELGIDLLQDGIILSCHSACCHHELLISISYPWTRSSRVAVALALRRASALQELNPWIIFLNCSIKTVDVIPCYHWTHMSLKMAILFVLRYRLCLVLDSDSISLTICVLQLADLNFRDAAER